MSEQAKDRNITEIQTEYTSLCNKAGHIQFQVQSLNKDLELINGRLKELNFEAAALRAKEAEAAKEAPAVEAVANA